MMNNLDFIDIWRVHGDKF